MPRRLPIHVLLLLFLLSACTPTPAVPTVTPPSPSTPTPAVTRTPTLRPTITFYPTYTPGPTRTATPASGIVWSPGIQPIILDDFLGSWSPVSNALAGIQRRSGLTTGTLVLAQAPNFSFSPLDPAHSDLVTPELTWSPDGKQLLYGISPKSAQGGYSIDMSGQMWVLDRTTGQSKNTEWSFLRGLNFLGWLDDQTMVFDSYTGGGHEDIVAWNYRTGKTLIQDLLPFYSLGPLQYPYVVANGCRLNCMVYVIVKNPRPRQGIEKPCIIACRSNIFPVVVDAKSSDPYEFESFAQDWLPGTDKLLVAARQYRQEDSPLSGLFLWDVVTDQVAPVMPGGVWGLYSPDGKILTWANYGQSAQYPSLVPGAPALDPIDLSHQTYLQLRDLASGKTLLSLPVQAWTRENGGDPDTFMDPYFTFSPDGRYITLVTPGRVTVDDLNWYAGDLNAGTSYFNVIDPQNRRLLKSIPVYGKVPYFGYRPIWSPDGSRFVYSDEKSNWQLFDVASASITPPLSCTATCSIPPPGPLTAAICSGLQTVHSMFRLNSPGAPSSSTCPRFPDPSPNSRLNFPFPTGMPYNSSHPIENRSKKSL